MRSYFHESNELEEFVKRHVNSAATNSILFSRTGWDTRKALNYVPRLFEELRKTYGFDHHLLKPVATAYSELVPRPVRLGVDGAAHEGALAAGARTIAVVGTGLDRVYPKRHLNLAHRIAERGALVSEFPLGTSPLPANFPQRNRIIAGLSQGTLVVEAALQSGSLITARMAAEQGREVFAIPGSIHAPQARGCHSLIRQGAKLVESAQDILEDLQLGAPATPEEGSTTEPPDDDLLDALGHDPVSLDALQARTGLDTATLQARLLELELDGWVGRLPGGLLQRTGQS